MPRWRRAGWTRVGYVSNPEFLAEGTAVKDFLEPDRIVIGSFEDADGDAVEALHEGLDAPVVRTDVPSAEMVKLAANAYLGTRISFINEIANVCELVGADVEKVAWGMGLDARIGTRYLQAGIGFGGSCFPKDISFLKLLAGNSGYHFQLLNAVIEVNELQKRRIVSKLQKHLGSLRGKTIALLGLAFKPNTDDMREAPSIVLASRLLAEGADVRAWDPVADASEILRGVTFADTVLDAVRGADAAVVVTGWDELRDLPRAEIRDAMRNPLIVDGRNVVDPGDRARSRVHVRGHRPRVDVSPGGPSGDGRAAAARAVGRRVAPSSQSLAPVTEVPRPPFGGHSAGAIVPGTRRAPRRCGNVSKPHSHGRRAGSTVGARHCNKGVTRRRLLLRATGSAAEKARVGAQVLLRALEILRCVDGEPLAVVAERAQTALGGELRERARLVVAALGEPLERLLVQHVHAHVDPVRELRRLAEAAHGAVRGDVDDAERRRERRHDDRRRRPVLAVFRQQYAEVGSEQLVAVQREERPALAPERGREAQPAAPAQPLRLLREHQLRADVAERLLER